MYERSQSESVREVQAERVKSERIAAQLRVEAAHQWQKALTGVLALPTATALTLAAGALQTAAFVERGFEMFQESAESMRRSLDGARREREHREEEQPQARA